MTAPEQALIDAIVVDDRSPCRRRVDQIFFDISGKKRVKHRAVERCEYFNRCANELMACNDYARFLGVTKARTFGPRQPDRSWYERIFLDDPDDAGHRDALLDRHVASCMGCGGCVSKLRQPEVADAVRMIAHKLRGRPTIAGVLRGAWRHEALRSFFGWKGSRDVIAMRAVELFICVIREWERMEKTIPFMYIHQVRRHVLAGEDPMVCGAHRPFSKEKCEKYKGHRGAHVTSLGVPWVARR